MEKVGSGRAPRGAKYAKEGCKGGGRARGRDQDDEDEGCALLLAVRASRKRACVARCGAARTGPWDAVQGPESATMRCGRNARTDEACCSARCLACT